MTDQLTYDCAVIGGGIAGLCLAIQLGQQGYRVIVFEKHSYPFHKVCGEYVSNESRNFLLRLGLPLDEWELPHINSLGISSQKGFLLEAPLASGGFGISRYKLDYELVVLARKVGVTVLENCKVNSISPQHVITNQGIFHTRIVTGAFGKTNPSFAKDPQTATNYIGVKYHIHTDLPANRIALHHFKKGYCGISKIEDNRYCLCYLALASDLKTNENSIAELEKNIVRKNPFLETIFRNSDFLFEQPLTVSNIRFEQRKLIDNQLIYLGDAAGCISPLTGNGMSMAAYSSFLLAGLIDRHLTGQLSEDALKSTYKKEWNERFSGRIRRGKQLQRLFANPRIGDTALRVLSPFKRVKEKVIASTHGEVF